MFSKILTIASLNSVRFSAQKLFLPSEFKKLKILFLNPPMVESITKLVNFVHILKEIFCTGSDVIFLNFRKKSVKIFVFVLQGLTL